MPHGKILPYHALKTLTQLHAELAGKLYTSQRETKRLRLAIFQVEAVMKMLEPDFDVRSVSAKRRNTGNPWFKRGTLYRAAIDAMRRAGVPMTAREIMLAVLDGKTPAPSRKQEKDVQAAILAGLRKRSGKGVAGEGVPTKWRLT